MCPKGVSDTEAQQSIEKLLWTKKNSDQVQILPTAKRLSHLAQGCRG